MAALTLRVARAAPACNRGVADTTPALARAAMLAVDESLSEAERHKWRCIVEASEPITLEVLCRYAVEHHLAFVDVNEQLTEIDDKLDAIMGWIGQQQ